MRLRGRQGRYGFDVRSFDIGNAEATADFAPVYPASEEITPKKLRELVGAALPRALADPLPAALKAAEALPPRVDALWALHRPRVARARRRRDAGGSRSTSCCCCRSGWRAAARARAEVAPALGAARASSSRATATCCRSG